MNSRACDMLKCKCGRCGHKWITRSKKEPKVCPKCKSPYWNKPITRPSVSRSSKGRGNK